MGKRKVNQKMNGRKKASSQQLQFGAKAEEEKKKTGFGKKGRPGPFEMDNERNEGTSVCPPIETRNKKTNRPKE